MPFSNKIFVKISNTTHVLLLISHNTINPYFQNHNLMDFSIGSSHVPNITPRYMPIHSSTKNLQIKKITQPFTRSKTDGPTKQRSPNSSSSECFIGFVIFWQSALRRDGRFYFVYFFFEFKMVDVGL